MKQITVPIPLEQVEEIHEVWLQLASILEISQNNEGSEALWRLIKPLEDRMSAVVFEEWEGMMDEAQNGGV